MIIRCDYCDMAYDGSKHLNCPHCLARRPLQEAKIRSHGWTDGINVAFYANNVAHGTLMTPNERRERLGLKKLSVPEIYVTVERR